MLGNKIKVTTLANTCTTGYSFIYQKFVETVYQILKMKSQCLIKPKLIQKLDGKATKPISYTILY